MSLPTVILMPFVVTNAKQNLFAGWKKNLFEKLTISALSIVLIYTFVWGLKFGGKVGAVNAIFQSVSALAVIVGIFILKERRLVVQKIIGGLLIVVGVALLI